MNCPRAANCDASAWRRASPTRYASREEIELLPMLPEARTDDNPWPQWPQIFRVSTAHEEGGERPLRGLDAALQRHDSGHVRRLHAVQVEIVKDGDRTRRDDLGVALTDRGNVARDARWMTNVHGVFAAGDVQRGQSLIVWAIAEGRSAARGIDQFLMGESQLPAPLS